MSKEIKRNPIFLTAPITVETDGPNRGKIGINAYNGGPMDTWYGKIIFDVAGMAHNAKMPILHEHSRTSIFGYSSEVQKTESSLNLNAQPSKKTETAREILDTLDEGFPWQASIGIWPDKIIILADEKTSMMVNGQTFVGPGEVWTESFVGEVSIVAVARDNTTSVVRLSRGADEISIVPEIRRQKEERMVLTLEDIQRDQPELLARIKTDARELAEKAAKAATDAQMGEEKIRITGILAITGMSADLKQQAIAGGKTLDGAKAMAWEAEQDARAKGLTNMSLTPAPVTITAATIQKETRGFAELVDDHIKTEKCKRGEAMLAVRGRYPEAHGAWIAASQKTTFINGRVK